MNDKMAKIENNDNNFIITIPMDKLHSPFREFCNREIDIRQHLEDFTTKLIVELIIEVSKKREGLSMNQIEKSLDRAKDILRNTLIDSFTELCS